jgi:NTE family protein
MNDSEPGSWSFFIDKENTAMEQASVEYYTDDAEVREVLHDVRTYFKPKGPRHLKISDLVDEEGNQYVDLVLEGGGILGIALVGFAYVLEEMKLRFRKVGGTSAGAINAMLIAALDLPQAPKSRKTLELLANVQLIDFVDSGESSLNFVRTLVEDGAFPQKMVRTVTGLPFILRLIGKLGLNSGQCFLEWMKGVLRNNEIVTTSDLIKKQGTRPAGLKRRPTASDAATEDDWGDGSANLSLVAADITTQTKLDFPKMAYLYWENPQNVDPAVFVRASMAIPLFFEPVRLRNIPKGEDAWQKWRDLGYVENIPDECLIVDGGILSNFPYDLFHRPNRVPICPTLGAKAISNRYQYVHSPFQLANAVFNTARHSLDYDFMRRHPVETSLLSIIDTDGLYWLDFKMKNDDRKKLFIRGAKAAAEFLKEFDWNNYKKQRKTLARAMV